MLLKAITTQNYESLESLTEENLTKTIAAQMYELAVLKGYTFDCNADLMRILEQSTESKELTAADEFKIVNHIFLRNCQVARQENECLSKYSLQRQNVAGFSYSYVPKDRGSTGDLLDRLNVFEDGSLKKADSIHIINEMLEFKKLYQNDPEKRPT